MRKIVQFTLSAVAWGVVLLFSSSFIIEIANLFVVPTVCAGIAIASTLLPKLFEMGVSDFKNSSIIGKLMPVVYVLLICYGMTFLPQTSASAVFVSVLLGNTSSYLGYLIGGLIK